MRWRKVLLRGKDGFHIFRFCIDRTICAGTRKNPERRRENQESGKELAPLRSARNPPNLQANSKNIPSQYQAKSTHYLMFSRMGQNERGLETKKKAGPSAIRLRGLRVDSSLVSLFFGERPVSNFALSAGGSGWYASQGRRAPGRGSTPRQWQYWWQPEYCAHRRCAAGSSRWAPRA